MTAMMSMPTACGILRCTVSTIATPAKHQRGEQEQRQHELVRVGVEADGLGVGEQAGSGADAGGHPVAEDQGGESLEASTGRLSLVVGTDVERPATRRRGRPRRRR